MIIKECTGKYHIGARELEEILENFPWNKNKNKFNNVCRKCISVKNKKWRKNNPEKVKQIMKVAHLKFKKNNPQKVNLTKRDWEKNNPEKFKEQRRRAEAKRGGNTKRKLRKAISNQVKYHLGKIGKIKDGNSSIDIIGWTKDTFEIVYKMLESQIKPGTIRSDYEIDHIFPQSAFDWNDPAQIKKCWEPQNLQLLTISENSVKSDNYDEYLFQKYLGGMPINDICRLEKKVRRIKALLGLKV